MKSFITHTIDGKYIREWLILGPFFPDDLDKDFLADVSGEANMEPKEGDTVTTSDGRTLTWKRYKSKEDVIDLLDAVGDYDHATAYAFCVLESETEVDARIYLGSDDGVAVWINGELVHSNAIERPLLPDEDIFEADLKAGTNRCLVKVSQLLRDWGFAVRVLPRERAVISGIITNEKGEPLPWVDVRLEQDGEEIARALANTSGGYQLDIHPVRGLYDLSATSGNLGDWQLGIQLDEGERRELNITLKEAISIEGTLLMLDDATPHVAVPVQAIVAQASLPVDEATRRGDPVGRPIATRLSDERGKYRFINLKPGAYQVRCQVLGGYVYYGKEKAGEPESQKAGRSGKGTLPNKPISLSAHKPISLRVEQGETLKNINFRFAPFKKGTWRNYGYLDGLTRDLINSIYLDLDGMMWFGTTVGVFRYDGKEFIHFTAKDGLAYGHLYPIVRDPDGMMWFGTWGGGVSRYDGKEFVTFTTKDGLASNNVLAIHCDPDGVLWLGTSGGGVSRYDGKAFVNFTTKDGLAHDNVYAIYRDPDGVMWFGTEGGVSRYIPPHSPLAKGGSKGGFVNFTTADGLADNTITSINSDPDGVMWFGTLGGVSRYIPLIPPLLRGEAKGSLSTSPQRMDW